MPGQPLTQVRYARRDQAGWITLDRPAQRNALTPVMIAELHRALDLADADPAVRALVITGAGPAFCAGADLRYFESLLDAEDGCDQFVAGLLRPLGDFLARLRASPAPVVAAVNGACAAGGLELVLCCDLIVAAAGATFTDAHARRGIAPALGGAAGLVRAVGELRAKQLLLLSDPCDAATMAAFGVVAEVADPDGLEARAAALAGTLSQRSPQSFAMLKGMVHRSLDPPWEESVESGVAEFRRAWGSADMREGIRAYTERREPGFTR
jgi:enoyl-CoA hydratase/carnithine racemase